MTAASLNLSGALVAAGGVMASVFMSADPAQAAVGLSGPFAPQQWILQRTIDGVIVDQLDFNQYQCSSIDDRSCVSIESTGLPSVFTVVGSDTGDIGAPAQQVDIAWIVKLTGKTPYDIRFTFDFETLDGAEQDEGQFFINDKKLVFDSTGGTPITGNLFRLTQGDEMSFRVFSVNNQGGVGVLTIPDFTATPVPGPLPILGVATAWRWSRRLRTSIRQRQS